MNQVILEPGISFETPMSERELRIKSRGAEPLMYMPTREELLQLAASLLIAEEDMAPWMQLARDTEDLSYFNSDSIRSTSAMDVKRSVLRQRVLKDLRYLGILEVEDY